MTTRPAAGDVLVEPKPSRAGTRTVRPGRIHSSRVVESGLWAAFAVLAEIYPGQLFGYSCLTLLFGVRLFWAQGGNHITASGLYGLASSVFGGYAGLYYWLNPGPPIEELVISARVCFWVLWFMSLWWPRRPAQPLRVAPGATHLISLSLRSSAILSAIFLVASLVILPGNGNVGQATIGAMSALIVAINLQKVSGSRTFLRLVLALGIVLVFASLVFTGYGRLNIVSLGLSGLVVSAARGRTRLTKLCTLLAIAPTLAILSIAREQFGQQTYGHPLNGIGSVVEPMSDFGRLAVLHSQVTFTNGGISTLISAATFWVPRSLWHGKPIGFGAELVPLLQPSLVNGNFGGVIKNASLAALAQGEWLYAFGPIGILFMVLGLGLVIRWIDFHQQRINAVAISNKAQVLYVMAIIIAIADIPDLMWGGTQVYVSRVGTRVVTTCLLVVFLQSFKSGRARSSKVPRGRQRHMVGNRRV